MENKLTFISLGGIGDVTKNMYAYILGNEILLIDCGIGFADKNLPGVDLLIPDISYLKTELGKGKKIVGMLLSHGHEDHIGALPFILPQLPNFPIYASVLTAALANDKLAEFRLEQRVNEISFSQPPIKLGNFSAEFIRMTHSIIDASNIFIRTSAGNYYHGSDYKFDFTPVDGKESELLKIAKAGMEGVTGLFSDCLGSERLGHSKSEIAIKESFEEVFRKSHGKVFVTTYSSNISRLNQAVETAISQGRRVCFMGRSLLKSRDIGRSLGYMKFNRKFEIKPHEVKKFKASQVMILVAGSQAQETSALTRIANNDDKDIRISRDDTVIFSSDPIPGNEENIYSLIDLLARRGAKVIHSDITSEFHVSGHGSENDIKLLISLTHPKYMVPIGGTYRQMVAYKEIAKSMNYSENSVFLLDSGQELMFDNKNARFGNKTQTATVFLDDISGEELENFIVVDRVRISKEGLMIVIVQIRAADAQVAGPVEVLTKGLIYDRKEDLEKQIESTLRKRFSGRTDPVSGLGYFKKTIEKTAEEILYREGRSPLIVPVIIEV